MRQGQNPARQKSKTMPSACLKLQNIWIWLSLLWVTWFPGYTWCFIYLLKGTQSLKTRVNMTFDILILTQSLETRVHMTNFYKYIWNQTKVYKNKIIYFHIFFVFTWHYHDLLLKNNKLSSYPYKANSWIWISQSIWMWFYLWFTGWILRIHLNWWRKGLQSNA